MVSLDTQECVEAALRSEHECLLPRTIARNTATIHSRRERSNTILRIAQHRSCIGAGAVSRPVSA